MRELFPIVEGADDGPPLFGRKLKARRMTANAAPSQVARLADLCIHPWHPVALSVWLPGRH